MDFFIIINGQQEGPFTIAQLAEKKITSETLVWREGMKDWQPAWMVSELRYILEENAQSQYKTTLPSSDNVATHGAAVPPIPPVNPTGNTQGNNQGFGQQFGQGYESRNNMECTSQNQMENPKGTPESKKTKKFHTFKFIGILILLLFIIMAVTNPSKESHVNAIRTEVSKAIDKATSSSGDDIFSQGFGMVARMMAGKFMDSALDQLFEYHNYILFSKGTVTLNEESHTVSFGIFGKVITMNADDMVKAIENNDASESSSVNNSSNGDVDNSSNGDNSSSEDSFQERLEDHANKAVDKMVDKASKKVEDRLNKKLEEIGDSSTVEKWIDKILEMF